MCCGRDGGSPGLAAGTVYRLRYADGTVDYADTRGEYNVKRAAAEGPVVVTQITTGQRDAEVAKSAVL